MRKFFLWIAFLIIIAILLIPAVTLADETTTANEEEVRTVDLPVEFYSWNAISAYAGCLALTILLTQFIKPIWPQNFKTQYLSFILACLLLNAANLALGKFTWSGFGLNFINAIIISFAANGGYNNLKEAIEEQNIGDEPKSD